MPSPAGDRRLLSDERGFSIVIVAFALPLLVLLAGFVVDIGNWWVHKRHLQVQADAAALAGATAFRFPACDDTQIEETAVEFSGGRDDDHPTVQPKHNLMPDTTPDEPDRMYTRIQEPTFWGDDPEVLDEDLENRPGPCDATFVDVKMTEEDSPGFFARAWVDEIDAQARVTLKRQVTAGGLRPVGVEDVNPVRVRVWMYDEDTGELLGDRELRRRKDPEGGVYIWDNALGNGDALPLTVANVTARRIGLRVALSGDPNSVTCGTTLVVCFGYKAPVPSAKNQTFERGLGRIRGYRLSGDGPQLGEVALQRPDAYPPTAPCGANDALDGGYFALSCSYIDIAVDMPGVRTTDDPATSVNDTATVEAFIKNRNGRDSSRLSWDPTIGRWVGTLPVLDKGPLPIDIEWSQPAGSTLPNGTACSGASPCKGNHLDAHAHFAGDRYWSGPIKHVRVDRVPTSVDLSTTHVGNVRRCAAGDAVSCTESFIVRIGVGGSLALREPHEPPIALRVSRSESLNGALDCDLDEPSFSAEIAYGCSPSYTANTGQSCPSKGVLAQTPQPWNCVALLPGNRTPTPTRGLNERILCVDTGGSAPNQTNCPGNQLGDAVTCPPDRRNRWPDYGAPTEDYRVLALFLVPFGTFDTQGRDTVPVLDFAYFYVTGWSGSNGGVRNPCQDESPSLEKFAPGYENEPSVISGHFVKPAISNSGGGASNDDCDTTSIGGCVAVMTK